MMISDVTNQLQLEVSMGDIQSSEVRRRKHWMLNDTEIWPSALPLVHHDHICLIKQSKHVSFGRSPYRPGNLTWSSIGIADHELLLDGALTWGLKEQITHFYCEQLMSGDG